MYIIKLHIYISDLYFEIKSLIESGLNTTTKLMRFNLCSFARRRGMYVIFATKGGFPEIRKGYGDYRARTRRVITVCILFATSDDF